MQSSADLKNLLDRIDHRGYPAYKDTKGEYQFPGYVLSIDHVQGDPFAAPSKLSIHVKGKTAAFPKELYQERRPRIALQDGLTRLFGRQAEQVSFKARGSGQSGLISVSRCGQEIWNGRPAPSTPKAAISSCGWRWGFRPMEEPLIPRNWKRSCLNSCRDA